MRIQRLLVGMMVCGGLLWMPARSMAQTEPQTEERGRTQGIKETEQFVKAGGTTSQAVATARLQIQKTLDAYNALVTQPSKNMKGDYKKLMKSVDSMNASVTDARRMVDQMQQASNTYFAGRGTTIQNIQDPQLHERAQQRLTDSQTQFQHVLKSLREASDALDPFRKELADQITYLGSDLTPSAMTSLKPNADKLNEHGRKVFSQTDDAITTTNEYFKGLKPAES